MPCQRKHHDFGRSDQDVWAAASSSSSTTPYRKYSACQNTYTNTPQSLQADCACFIPARMIILAARESKVYI